jgi:hypothetical protein
MDTTPWKNVNMLVGMSRQNHYIGHVQEQPVIPRINASHPPPRLHFRKQIQWGRKIAIDNVNHLPNRGFNAVRGPHQMAKRHLYTPAGVNQELQRTNLHFNVPTVLCNASSTARNAQQHKLAKAINASLVKVGLALK